MKTMVRESLCWSCECRQCMQLHYNNITPVSTTSPSTPLYEQVFSVSCLSHLGQLRLSCDAMAMMLCSITPI